VESANADSRAASGGGSAAPTPISFPRSQDASAETDLTRRGRPARAQTNDEVLRDAAVALVSQAGWDSLTLSAVARQADLTLGAIYSRFENKSELGLDLWATRVLPEFRARLRTIELALTNPEASDAFVVLLQEHLAANPLHTCFNELVQSAAFDPIMQDVIFDDIQEVLTPWLAGDPATSARNGYLIGLLIGASLLQPVAAIETTALDGLTTTVWQALLRLDAPSNLNSESWLPLVNWTPASEDVTIEQIHTAFIQTVAKSGYEKATISRVCRAAGISSGSLFSRFESKAEVFADAYRTLMIAAIGQDSQAMARVGESSNPQLAYAEYLLARLRPEHRHINIVHLEFLRLASHEARFKSDWDSLQEMYDEYYDQHYEAKVGQESLAAEQKFLRASARWGLRFLSLAYPDIWRIPLEVVSISLSRLPDYYQPRNPGEQTPKASGDAAGKPIAHRRRSGRALANDERLRHAAMATIVDAGWSGTSLTQVAKAAGLTLGAVYSRYEDKTDLAIDLWRQHGAPILDEAVGLAISTAAQDREQAAFTRLLEPDGITRQARVATMELATEALFDADLREEVTPHIVGSISSLLKAADGSTEVLFWFATAMGLFHFRNIDPNLPHNAHNLETLRDFLSTAPACPMGCDGGRSSEIKVEISCEDPYEKALLEAAREVVSERGFDRSTIAAICRRAGISSGSLFGRYSTKIELISECVRRSQVTRIRQQGAFQRESLPDVPAQLRANNYVRGVLSPWNRQTRRCFLEFSRIARTHVDAREAWKPMLHELNSTFAREMPDISGLTASPEGLHALKAALWSLRLLSEFEPGLSELCYCPSLDALGRAVTSRH